MKWNGFIPSALSQKKQGPQKVDSPQLIADRPPVLQPSHLLLQCDLSSHGRTKTRSSTKRSHLHSSAIGQCFSIVKERTHTHTFLCLFVAHTLQTPNFPTAAFRTLGCNCNATKQCCSFIYFKPFPGWWWRYNYCKEGGAEEYSMVRISFPSGNGMRTSERERYNLFKKH